MHTPRYYSTEKASMERLQRYLGLKTGVREKDVVFVSLDMEASMRDGFHVNEFGISCLDTRDILLSSPEKALITYNFPIGSQQDWMRKMRKVNRSLRFGTTERLFKAEIVSKITSCFQIEDRTSITTVSTPKYRNIVLLSHGFFAGEEMYLKHLNINLEDSGTIIDIYDTHRIAKFVIGRKFPYGCTLRNVLRELHIPFTRNCLHNSGNDAHLTLQSLLMLVQRSTQHPPSLDFEEKCSVERERILAWLEAAAQTNLPDRMESNERYKKIKSDWEDYLQMMSIGGQSIWREAEEYPKRNTYADWADTLELLDIGEETIWAEVNIFPDSDSTEDLVKHEARSLQLFNVA
jgi:hypothetical protein